MNTPDSAPENDALSKNGAYDTEEVNLSTEEWLANMQHHLASVQQWYQETVTNRKQKAPARLDKIEKGAKQASVLSHELVFAPQDCNKEKQTYSAVAAFLVAATSFHKARRHHYEGLSVHGNIDAQEHCYTQAITALEGFDNLQLAAPDNDAQSILEEHFPDILSLQTDRESLLQTVERALKGIQQKRESLNDLQDSRFTVEEPQRLRDRLRGALNVIFGRVRRDR